MPPPSKNNCPPCIEEFKTFLSTFTAGNGQMDLLPILSYGTMESPTIWATTKIVLNTILAGKSGMTGTATIYGTGCVRLSGLNVNEKQLFVI